MDHNLNILGLAMRKGDLVIGSKQVIDYIQSNKKPVVFLASDAGKNTQKKIEDKTNHYEIILHQTFTTKTLSLAIGKKAISVVAIKQCELKNALK